jgi:hypothetical protein
VSYAKCTDCCGSLFWWADTGDGEPPVVCPMCAARSKLCQHNLFSRVAAGGKNVAFTSRPQADEIILHEAGVTYRLRRGGDNTWLPVDRRS